jgi:osmotically-inducible protein OsmY
MLRDKLFSLTRRSSSGVSAVAQQAAGQATGLVRETVPHPRDNPNPDDQTLKDRIESEVFRDPAIPKGNININVADGIVVLRGELETAADIDNVIAKVRAVPDVQRVESYLHLPGTPAPNKASVLHVS